MVDDRVYILISFGLYLVFMLGIGWYFYNRTKDLSDYILGGRGLNSWVASMSAQASDMSGWLLMGLPGFAYLAGLEAMWIALGLAVGTYLNWRFVARRLRQYTEAAGDSITLPVYFENRFRDKSQLLRIISALFIMIFFMIYTSSGFVAGAKLFSTIFDLSYTAALIIGVGVIIIYTFLGGFMAVSWTDFFQGTLMFIAIIAVPAFAFGVGGGVGETVSKVESINPQLLDMFTGTGGELLGFTAIISSLAWGLGYFGQPHILARFMAIRSAKMVKKARIIATVWVVISLFFAVVVGLIGLVTLPESLSGPDTETVFLRLIDMLFHPLIAGFFLAAILAAIMSTADSQLLVASSAVTEDMYRLVKKRSASDKELVWISRGSVVAIALVAFVIALDPDSSVLNLVAYAWAGFGSTFGPLILFSLFWRKMNRSAAFAGMITGGVTVLIWKQLSGGLFDMYEMVPGFLLSSLAIVLATRFGSKPADEVVEEFERVV